MKPLCKQATLATLATVGVLVAAGVSGCGNSSQGGGEAVAPPPSRDTRPPSNNPPVSGSKSGAPSRDTR